MDRTAFYAALRARSCTLFGTSLSQGQVDTLDAIIDEADKLGLPVSHAAYCMATAYHEVGSSLRPIRENLTYTSAGRIREVWPSRFASDAAATPYVRRPQKLANLVYGGRLGNTGPNDGWTYRGGGLPQTTGKDNYAAIGKMIGVDLVAQPGQIVQPKVAVAALVLGASRGAYTGRKLSDFLPGDYFGARAIINGDKSRKEGNTTIGAKIAGYARQFEAALSAAGYGVKVEQPAPPPPEPVQEPEPVPAPAPPPVAPSAPVKPASRLPAFIRALLSIIAKLFGKEA